MPRDTPQLESLLREMRREGVIDDAQREGALERAETLPDFVPAFINTVSGFAGIVGCILAGSGLACMSSEFGWWFLAITSVAAYVGFLILRRILGDSAESLVYGLVATRISALVGLCTSFALLTEDPYVTSGAVLVLAVVVYLADPDFPVRALSALVGFFSLDVLLMEAFEPDLRDHWIHYALLGITVATASLSFLPRWSSEKLTRALHPLGLASVCAAIVGLLGTLAVGGFDDRIMRLIVAVPLTITLATASTRLDPSRRETIAWAGALALALALLANAGTIFAVWLLALGFWSSRVILINAGVACLIGFTVQYYYFLEVSLLSKSAILLSTGAAILALRAALLTRPWMRELTSPAKEES